MTPLMDDGYGTTFYIPVENGGKLLLTGDPRFGWSRQPDRPDRLSKLGLKADFKPIGLPDAKAFMANIPSENKSVLGPFAGEIAFAETRGAVVGGLVPERDVKGAVCEVGP